jgi:RND family efflux transporter MFP subunit
MNPHDIVIKPANPPVPDATAPSATTRTLRNAGIVALLLIVAGALAGLLPRWHHQLALRQETLELATPTVAVISPAPGKAPPTLVLPAEVRPYLDSPIYARASGYIKRWLVDIGAQVKEGDLLAEIDTPELNQELAQARAQLVQANAALELARTTAARWIELLKTTSVSEQETAEKNADLELKKADVAAAEANVRRFEDLQAFESVRAPFAGTITVRNIDVGQLITAGSTTELFRLAQTGTLRVYVRVPDTAARSVVPGQMAQLSVAELPNRVFPAKVVRTSGAVSSDSRTLLTELSVDNSHGEILAGTYAQVTFTEARPEAPLTIPSNALLFRAEGTQVGVVNLDGKVELRTVSLGRDFGPSVEVLRGLGPADRVILNPADSLVSGITVHVAANATNALGEK